MTRYEVFGGVLQSDIEFPELLASERERPDWTLRCRESLVPLSDAVVVGVEDLIVGVAARLERGRTGSVFRFDDTGSFDIARDGARIDWSPLPGASPGGRACRRVGTRPLRSAPRRGRPLPSCECRGDRRQSRRPRWPAWLRQVDTDDGARCQWRRLVADDTVRLSGAPPRAAVAVPSLRLREDTAARFGVGREPEVGDKVIVRDAPVALERWLPLDAIYVLVPRASDGAAALVRRQRLAPLEATLALVRHGKIAPLLGGQEAPACCPARVPWPTRCRSSRSRLRAISHASAKRRESSRDGTAAPEPPSS